MDSPYARTPVIHATFCLLRRQVNTTNNVFAFKGSQAGLPLKRYMAATTQLDSGGQCEPEWSRPPNPCLGALYS